MSRKTNQVDHYLFPVGSSQGVLRYRPVEIKPLDISSNTFTARLANLDATLEGYDRSLYDTTTCNLNPLYYHQINRIIGNSSVDLNIYFDELADPASMRCYYSLNRILLSLNTSRIPFGVSKILAKK